MKPWKLFISAVASTALFLAVASPARAVVYTATVVTPTFSVASAVTEVTALTGVDDEFAEVVLPFTFSFYGTEYNTVFVNSNGLLTFGSGNSAFSDLGDLFTSPSQAAIAVLWDDYVIDNAFTPQTARVFTFTQGVADEREFVIQWDKVSFFGDESVDTLTFQAILFENPNNILLNYLDLESGDSPNNDGALATVGIKDAGDQGPDRLLVLAHDTGPNEFVETGKSTLISLNVVPEPVPEPATLMLLGIGLAGLGFSRRRKLH